MTPPCASINSAKGYFFFISEKVPTSAITSLSHTTAPFSIKSFFFVTGNKPSVSNNNHIFTSVFIRKDNNLQISIYPAGNKLRRTQLMLLHHGINFRTIIYSFSIPHKIVTASKNLNIFMKN